MRLTEVDLQIMKRFDWVPFKSERAQPSYNSKLQEYAICHGLARGFRRWPEAHYSLRDYYTFWSIERQVKNWPL